MKMAANFLWDSLSHIWQVQPAQVHILPVKEACSQLVVLKCYAAGVHNHNNGTYQEYITPQSVQRRSSSA